MKKLILMVALALFSACQNDDTDFSAFTSYTGTVTTIYINYNGSSVSISGDAQGIVSADGADVVVTSQYLDSLLLVLSGSTSDGSLLVYRSRKYGIRLNGVSLSNPDGPAINNQCSKSLYVECAEGTTNILADGAVYSTKDYDQKGTLFSEGQLFFCGAGTLTVNAHCKNAIASDDYITILPTADISITTDRTGTNGIKANDGMFVNGGTLNIDVASDGGRGIRCEARTIIADGNVTITTTGGCLIEEVDGVRDTTSAACIKSDSLFVMTGGKLDMLSTGDGGKGIRCSENIEIKGGTLVATTEGNNNLSKPKALKSDTGIIVSGGSFTATVRKSWACDNGTESEDPEDHLTVLGTPATSIISKRSVVVIY